ncbi:uncharacterized protein CDAR_260781 [Caerostris darwini]|uniref:Uncharacterized protein n=1 Tax=Caerostris darwini TaxID=1538125 RepID=A0AAV4WVI7_9ARAC|nr:uncharacterized protein CDAR_260781 [Caerostris darwini]
MSVVEFKEVDHTDAVIDDKWEAMRRELQFVRAAMRLALRQLIKMRKEKVAYQVILNRELGINVDPVGPPCPVPLWRNRACEKTYLKHELADLVDRLQAIDPKFRFDPECVPSTLSTSRDVLLTHKQMDDLMVLFDKYSVYRSVNQRQAADAFKAYLKMRDEYEDRLIQNNAMIDEIYAVRKRINELKNQEREDKCFMNFLVSYKLYKEKKLPQKTKKKKESSEIIVRSRSPTKEVSLPGEESEMLKYKKLWKDNLTHKEQFKWLLESMKEKLEDAHQRIVVAEDLCANNVANFHKLEYKVREETLALRRYRDFEDVGENKFKKVFWGVSGQLEASRNENQYIRFFLQNTVLPKEKDFLKLKANMETKADEYRQHIERETPPPPPPPPVVEEKPDKKGKKKKK